MPGQHAFLPPSGSDGWMTCPHWAWANAERVDDGDNEWSAHGTAAHTIRESCLKNDLDPADFYGAKIKVGGFEFTVDDEMVKALQPGIDEIRSYIGPKSFLIVEQRVYFDEWLPKGQFGSLDCGVISPDLIVISDLKYGEGIPVSPVWNKQQIIYGAGLWIRFARHRTKAKKVRIIIDQPRHSDGGGFWDTTVDEILDFMEKKAAPAARRVFKEPGTRVASEKGCYWCPEKRECHAYDAFRLKSACMDFDDVSKMVEIDKMGLTPKIPPRRLTLEEKSFLIRNKSAFVDWIDGMHAEALNDALRGSPWPETRVEEGRRPNREFSDEAAARRYLLKRLPYDEVFETKMISVAAAEDKLPTIEKEKFKSFWTQGEAKPVLAFEGGKRRKGSGKPYKTVVDEFDDESN